jgi:ribonuclease HII
MWREEWLAWQEGCRCVAGIDEAGRGALAGPVVAACVVLPLGWDATGIRDSKTLTSEQRDLAFDRICTAARGIGIGMADASEVDAVNVLRATHNAMRCALSALPGGLCPDLVLIDGLPVRPFPAPQLALVGGDGLSASIAAASIIAKVTRDRLMIAHDEEFSHYGFANHKGYGSPKHLQALAEHGPCPLHRLTFRPCMVEDDRQRHAATIKRHPAGRRRK